MMRRHVVDVKICRPHKANILVTTYKKTKHGWLVPKLSNQGAVFVDKDEKLVRFMQVTRALKHSFIPCYFVEFLRKLAQDTNLGLFTKVQLYYVVPVSNIERFTVSIRKQAFQKQVLNVVAAAEQSHGGLSRSVSGDCKLDISVFSVDY
ncbi:unnamed protein product [Phytophthora lilii]|uniref:Unnamed protein product n=1 Tax=Phytophthora lilii TaxID=2077276 RepID=A0A9W6TH91_9STRA|nr:unnamed protein product [Phytophthora lilii]